MQSHLPVHAVTPAHTHTHHTHSIQTAPVVETQNKPFFNYEESRRRASDGHTLEDKKKKMNLTELNSGTNQEDSAQILTDSPNPVW